MGLDKGVSPEWTYRFRRHFALINEFLDQEENHEERKSLVEYGGFFANPEVYSKVKEQEQQHSSRVENFDEVVKEQRRQAALEAARDKAAGLVPIIEEKP